MDAVKSCHNCRKRRLRCDRSVPTCNKCSSSGQACLGYGKLYKWTDSVASRGRMMGKKTFAPAHSCEPALHDSLCQAPFRRQKFDKMIAFASAPTNSLVDPLFHGLDSSSRYYLDYFSKRICKELVAHDSLHLAGNPFRQLVAMATLYPFLQHIIVAASALHYSNLMHSSYSIKHEGATVSLNAQIDALHARHKAIKALQKVLERFRLIGDDETDADEKDAMLATILFFINFGLIDSGKGGCRAHMQAARRLIATQLSRAATLPEQLDNAPCLANSVPPWLDHQISKGTTSPLCLPQFRPPPSSTSGSVGVRDYVASDSVAYYIWGSTLDSLSNSGSGMTTTIDIDTSDIRLILIRTEANSYHSCPAHLQLNILQTSCLAQEISANGSGIPTSQQMDSFVDLLREAQSFDVEEWAIQVTTSNASLRPDDELEIRLRTYMAATYRAAACLYVLLAAPGLHRYVEKKAASLGSSSHDLPFLPTRGDFTTTMLQQLSQIPSSSPLFRYTTWPVFMTGVEAVTPERRAWVLDRLRAMWDLCPWGMIRSAMEALTEIWQLRDGVVALKDGEDGVDGAVLQTGDAGNSWLIQLRSMCTDFLIV